jgi:hypothetical protein
MSQDESKRIGNHEESDDVEAHASKFAANDEGKTEGDDEVEAHVHRSNAPKKN